MQQTNHWERKDTGDKYDELGNGKLLRNHFV